MIGLRRVSSEPRDPSPRPSTRSRRWTQLRAVLAGGLTFGIGASATVSAWTDTESATGEFQAGEFMIEANVDGSWNSTRQMTFDASAMLPGAVTHAPVRLRTTPDTTVAGDLSVHGAPDSGNGAIIDSLEYRAVLQPVPAGSTQGPACAAEAFTASAQYVFGSSGAWQPMATVASAAGTQRVAAAQGDTLQYCFEVRLRDDAPNDAQGTRAAFTWTWDATSVSAG